MFEHNKIIRFVNLYSGSDGNCTYIKTPDAEMLFDAGKSARTLKCALNSIGTDISNISDIFITHDHIDHISALKTLIKHCDAVIHTPGIEPKGLKIEQGFFNKVDVNTLIFQKHLGNTVVTSFTTSHDSRFSVGYRIDYKCENGCHSFGIATDTGYVTEGVRSGLTGCEAVMLEANHDEEMLMYGPYPAELKARIMSRYGHLSNRDCASFSKELVKAGTRRIMLAHLSATNNTPNLAYECVTGEIDNGEVSIVVASNVGYTELI